jgi:hypothetical protein
VINRPIIPNEIFDIPPPPLYLRLLLVLRQLPAEVVHWWLRKGRCAASLKSLAGTEATGTGVPAQSGRKQWRHLVKKIGDALVQPAGGGAGSSFRWCGQGPHCLGLHDSSSLPPKRLGKGIVVRFSIKSSQKPVGRGVGFKKIERFFFMILHHFTLMNFVGCVLSNF